MKKTFPFVLTTAIILLTPAPLGQRLKKSEVLVESMQKYAHIISFNELVEPTPRIMMIAKLITDKTSDIFQIGIEALRNMKFEYYPFSVKTGQPPQTPRQLEKSGEGDCTDQAYWLYSFFKAVKMLKPQLNFDVKFAGVYVDNEGKDIFHFCVAIIVDEKEVPKKWKEKVCSIKDDKAIILLDPIAREKGFGIKHKLFRLLDERETLASYYADASMAAYLNGKWKESIDLLKIAKACKQDSPAVMYRLIKHYFLEDKYTRAKDLADKLVEMLPTWPHAHYLLGQAYYFLNNYAKAEEHLNIAKQLDPTFCSPDVYLKLIEMKRRWKEEERKER